jgi:glycosyltransferase EpsJ
MPKISVIVPVYRAEHCLGKCTGSILRQSFSDFELLLVEDGSPDRCCALCDETAAKDSRVRVFHKENGGVSSARNLGLREAKGSFIAFADADDYLEETALEKLAGALEASGADTAGCAHYNELPSGERRAEPGPLPAGVYGADEIRSGVVYKLLGHRLGRPGEVFNGFIWRFLFSRELIVSNHITFSGSYLEDELFLMEYFCHARKLAMLDEPLYHYLQNPLSVTRNYLPGYMDTFRRVMEAKKELCRRFSLELPGWEDNSNWAGLLIAVGNEYAPGNHAGFREKREKVRQFTELPEMARAKSSLSPRGLGRNKQLVATLVRLRWFTLLTWLYSAKNKGKQAT